MDDERVICMGGTAKAIVCGTSTLGNHCEVSISTLVSSRWSQPPASTQTQLEYTQTLLAGQGERENATRIFRRGYGSNMLYTMFCFLWFMYGDVVGNERAVTPIRRVFDTPPPPPPAFFFPAS